MVEKDIRFTNKRIDDAWKESAQPASYRGREMGERSDEAERSETNFSAFVASLGVQCLIQLGEVRTPESGESKVDLEGAKETIDLLLILKEKTKGNLERREEELMTHLLADLQMKFVARQQTTA